MSPHPDSLSLRGAAHRTMGPAVMIVGILAGSVLGWLLIEGLLLLA